MSRSPLLKTVLVILGLLAVAGWAWLARYSWNPFGTEGDPPNQLGSGIFSMAGVVILPVAIGGLMMIVGALFAKGLSAPILATVGAGLVMALGPIPVFAKVSWILALSIYSIYGLVIVWIWSVRRA